MEEPLSYQQEVFRLALPAVGEHLLRFSAGLVDTFLVGHLGAVPLAIFGLSHQFFVLSAILIGPLVVGCAVLTAQALGARDAGRAHLILSQGLWLALGCGSAMMLAGMLFAPQALRLLGAEPMVVQQGATFFRIQMVSVPLHMTVFVLSACLRGAGDTRSPMIVMVFWAGVQISTAFLLVNAATGPLNLGVDGVAVAGVLGRTLALFLLLAWLASGRLALDLKRSPWRPDLAAIRDIIRLGLPSGGEQLALRLGQTVNIRLIAALGTVEYASYLIGFNTLSVALMVGVGFTMAATTIVGQQIGAGRPMEAHKGASQAWISAMAIMSLLGVAYVLWTPGILGFFTDELQVITLATLPLQLVSFALPFEATNQILSGAFRGAGDTRWPMLVTTGGNWLIRIPLTLILIGPLGLTGAWLAIISEMTLRALINIWRFQKDRWLNIFAPTLKGAIQ